MTIPYRTIDWKAYDAHHAAGGSDADFARRLGMDKRTFWGRKQRRPPDAPERNGDLPALLTPVHSNAPERTDALQRTASAPAHPSALELDDIRDRLATLEAFMSAIQAAHHSASERISALPAHPSAPVHPSAPERTAPPTWKNQGMHLATDMAEAIATYARQHRLEKREVLDLALRTFFAAHGEGGDADA